MASRNIAWDASPSSGVAGYKISYGNASGVYTQTVDVGLVLTTTINNLTEGMTWYFAAQAYNATLDSGYSNEINAFIPVPPDVTPPSAPTGISIR